jgi:hypothetical protein
MEEIQEQIELTGEDRRIYDTFMIRHNTLDHLVYLDETPRAWVREIARTALEQLRQSVVLSLRAGVSPKDAVPLLGPFPWEVHPHVAPPVRLPRYRPREDE